MCYVKGRILPFLMTSSGDQWTKWCNECTGKPPPSSHSPLTGHLLQTATAHWSLNGIVHSPVIMTYIPIHRMRMQEAGRWWIWHMWKLDRVTRRMKHLTRKGEVLSRCSNTPKHLSLTSRCCQLQLNAKCQLCHCMQKPHTSMRHCHVAWEEWNTTAKPTTSMTTVSKAHGKEL